MKSNYLAFIIIVILSFGLSAQEAVAVGGCSSVTVSDIPDFPGVRAAFGYGQVIAQNNQTPPSCRQAVRGSVFFMKPRLVLQQLSAANTFVDVETVFEYEGHQFTNLSQGVYRVRVTTPFYDVNTCGGSGNRLTQLFTQLNQFIGLKGSYDWDVSDGPVFGLEGFQENTNEVVVGATSLSDINATIADVNGTPAINFNDNDQVFLDLSDCTNFNRYRIAIQQVTGSNNYQSGGWQIGTPTSINLNDIWTQNFSSWKFWSNRRFRVQVTLDNQDCQNGVWNEKFYFFDTCSGGANTCRFTENTELDVFPNPATDMFIVRNLDLSKANRYDLMITDVTGRMIRNERLTGSQVDVSDLNPGLYIVRINADGEKAMQSKVVVK